jgi:hypothetical protein
MKIFGSGSEYPTARQINDTAKMFTIERDADAVAKEMSQTQMNFIKNNPSSFVTPSLLRSMSYELEATEIEAIINAMDTSCCESACYTGINNKG